MTKFKTITRKSIYLFSIFLPVALFFGCQESAEDKKTIEERREILQGDENDQKEDRSGSDDPEQEEKEGSTSLIDHVIQNDFSLNGNGSVIFTESSTLSQYGDSEGGSVMIKGGKATLKGKFQIASQRSLRITDLQAVSGRFDATRNEPSSGRFTLTSSGNLRGTLYANGDSQDLLITLEEGFQ